MNTTEKIIAGTLTVAALFAMDLLKLNDPVLRYSLLSVFGLITGGHLVTNLPFTLSKT